MHHRISALIACLATAALFSSNGSTRGQTLVEAGMPALSREWSGADYQRAAEVLASGKVPLPTLATPEGRAFFKRLTSPENLSFAANTSVPISVRMGDFSGSLMTGVKTILMQYLTAANKGARVHTEVAMQMSFMLHLAAAGIKLTDEFIPTIPKDDKYEIRLGGLKKMYGGMTTIFVGAETSLGENTFYSPEDLSLLLQAMSEVLPTMKTAFPPDFGIELRKKLEKRKAAFPGEKDRQILQKMIAEIGS
jgi:hypothetical protein